MSCRGRNSPLQSECVTCWVHLHRLGWSLRPLCVERKYGRLLARPCRTKKEAPCRPSTQEPAHGSQPTGTLCRSPPAPRPPSDFCRATQGSSLQGSPLQYEDHLEGQPCTEAKSTSLEPLFRAVSYLPRTIVQSRFLTFRVKDFAFCHDSSSPHLPLLPSGGGLQTPL